MLRRRSAKPSSYGQDGFTLVELLVAAAIFVTILVALGGLLVNSTRAYGVNERVSERQQDTQAAIALFQEELSLAGYRGVCSTATSNTFSQPTFEVERGAAVAPAPGEDLIRIRYFDDRYSGSACGTLRTVTFSVGDDGSGNDALLMLFDGLDGATPVISGVMGLRLFGYVDSTGGLSTEMPTAGFIAVSVELTFSDERVIRFVVGLRNPQRNAVQS